MPAVLGIFLRWFRGLKISRKSGFAWLPLVGVLALVALVYPTMKYVTSPDSNFDIRQRAVIAGCEGYTSQSVCDSRGCDWYPGEPRTCNEWETSLAICTVSNATCSQDGCTYTAAKPTVYRDVCDCGPYNPTKCEFMGCGMVQEVKTLGVPESCTGRYEVKGLCTGWTVATTGSCGGVPDGEGGGGSSPPPENDICASGEREVQYYGECKEPNYTITSQLDNGRFCCARVFASPLPTPSPVRYCSENKRDECHSQQASCIEDLNGGYCDVYIDCNPGSRECVGTSQSRFCKPSGIWGPTSSCTSGLGCNVSTGYCISAPSSPSPVPSPSPSPVPQCSTGTYGACSTGEQCLASPYGYYCRAVTTAYCSYENSRECGLDCTPSLYGGSCPSSSDSSGGVDIGEGTVSQCSGYNFGICPIGQKCLSSPYGYYCRAIASPYCSYENYTKCDVDCEEDLKGGSCPVVSSWDAFWGDFEEAFEGEDSPLNAYSDSDATTLELWEAELEGSLQGLKTGGMIAAGIYALPLLSGPALTVSQTAGAYMSATLSTAPIWVKTALNLAEIGGTGYGVYVCDEDPDGDICLGIVAGIMADTFGFIQSGTAAIDDVAGQVTNYVDNWLDDIVNIIPDTGLTGMNLEQTVMSEVEERLYYAELIRDDAFNNGIPFGSSISENGEVVGSTYDEILRSVASTAEDKGIPIVDAMAEVVYKLNPKQEVLPDVSSFAFTIDDQKTLTSQLLCGETLDCLQLPVLEQQILGNFGIESEIIVGLGGGKGVPEFPYVHGALLVDDEILGYYAPKLVPTDKFERYTKKLNWGDFGY